MIRTFFFVLTNLSIILVFGIFFSLTGINNGNIIEILIISLFFGFLGSIISLFMSKWIALYSVNGKIIQIPKNKTEIWLFNTIEKYSKKVGINTPEIAIYNSLDMNAFATGAQKNSSLIALSSSLLKNMNTKEIEAIIGHEITHIVNGDMVTMTLIQGTVNTFIIFISRILTKIITTSLSYNQKNNEDNQVPIDQHPYNVLISTILESTLGILASIITMWFSRHREYYADAGSAKLVGSKNMISALKKLKYSIFMKESDIIRTLYINGNLLHPLFNLFSSHPPLEMRINALKKSTYI
ncbi:heat shock protein, peptidase family M48 [Buchnera aphidicola (Cinara tujafilina)]|uniref:Heat shock protein, peptidase family M48 n=1 Tax=Buchnera aphidicola (Cinara tujafilina) TaxID=261317 RepID=F7WZD2_9GAMM|nr:protease HtpX [Buchnera aphidicola]AEH39794.1 heat shock protein, peptidase family M48 [Buchnera aphidicola (Cinara tujafilina)]